MMRAVIVKQFGGVEELCMGMVAKPKPKHDEILIKLVATGVNRMDILQRQGRYPPPAGSSDILGPEGAGIVTESSSSLFRKGDRVMALLSGGGYAEYAAVHPSLCLRMPMQLTFEEAACIPEVWLTAFQHLHMIAAIRPGDDVLVHAAASGVGTAAIQLCREAGAKTIIATAGSTKKLDFCRELGATHVLDYNISPTFAEYVHQATNGKGASLLLDCLGAQQFKENMESCSEDARWVLYGLMGGHQVEGVSLATLLRKRISIFPTTLRSRSLEYKAELVRRFAADALPKFADGTLKPILDRVFKLDEVRQAHEMMEARKNVGKIVLLIDEAAAAEVAK